MFGWTADITVWRKLTSEVAAPMFPLGRIYKIGRASLQVRHSSICQSAKQIYNFFQSENLER